MPAKKALKDTKDTQAAAKGAGGFSAFQLLIFVIATSSMAMNFAMIYGVIPLQGKLRYIPPLFTNYFLDAISLCVPKIWASTFFSELIQQCTRTNGRPARG